MSSQKSFADALQQAAQDNPLAAGLIGLGALWLLSGRLKSLTSLRNASLSAVGAAQTAAESASDFGGRIAETSNRNASRAGETISASSDALQRRTAAIAGGVSDAATATPGAARDAFEQAAQRSADAVRGAAHSFYASGQTTYSRLQDLLGKQPVAVGAIGLALGSAVAASLPLTATESGRLRPVADTVKHTFDEGSEVIRERSGRVAEAAQQEARRQGLDPQHIGDQVRDKAREASTAVRDSVREHTS